MKALSRLAVPLFVLLSILLSIVAFQIRPNRPILLAAPTPTPLEPTPTRVLPTPVPTKQPTHTRVTLPTFTLAAILITPSPTPTATPTATPTPTPTPSLTQAPRFATTAIPYRLRSGDILRRIASDTGVSLAEILEANQLQEKDIIRGGQIIYLPPGSLLPEYWPKPTPRPLPTFTTDRPPAGSLVVYLGREDRKQVSLTFDVGYYPSLTSHIARELETRGVRSTFFLIGSTAETHPQIVYDIVAHGHELANHSWSHSDMRYQTGDEIADELSKTEGLVRSLAPQTTTRPFFRAPFGHTNDAVVRAVQGQGFYVVDWTIDALDWIEDITAQEVHWTVARQLQPGAIVCMHGSSTATVQALPLILDTIEAEGYTAVPLSELLAPR